jgi:hypothetical protein
MHKALLALICVGVLAGCSSTPDVTYNSPYCYTDQKIVNADGTVSSETHLECTDRPSRQAEIQRAGIDKNCKEFWYPERRWGEMVEVRGVRCEKFDGTWEIVNIDGNVR